MTIGNVYIAVSDSFPGDCKVGFTLRPVPERMAELQRQYRTRHSFRAFDQMMVKNPRRVEWWAHQRLRGYRNAGTELFECSAEMGKAAVVWAVDKVIEEERQNPYEMRPRPKRAPQRWQRARHSYQEWLLALVFTVPLMAWLLDGRPELPTWMPTPVLSSAELIRTLF